LNIIEIGKTYKNINRLREILNIAAGQGLGHIIHSLHLDRHLPISKRAAKDRLGKTLESRIRIVCEKLGPTFVKFGQLLSLRADIVPPQLVNELSKLQDRVEPFDFMQVKKIIEEELNGKLEVFFSKVDEKPLASASMAQVHAACLRKTGEMVVIKVQRPEIEDDIARDLDILYNIAVLIEKHIPESKVYNPIAIVDEFSRTLEKEMDFTYEASAAYKLGRCFNSSGIAVIPKIYFDYSTRKVLVMEKIEGTRISDLKSYDTSAKKKIAENMVNAYLKMIFELKYFHADPHPGNLFVLKDKRIGFVDFGMTGRIDDLTLKKLAYLFLVYSGMNLGEKFELYRSIGIVEEDEDNSDYQKEAADFFERYNGYPLNRINVGCAINEFLELSRRHGAKIPKEFIMLGKTLFAIEKIVRELNPKFSFITLGKPFAEGYVKKSLSPSEIAKQSMKSIAALFGFLKKAPVEFNDLLVKLKKGKLKIEFEHIGLEPLISEMDKSSNRLTVGFIIGSLIIGSSIIIHTGFGPRIFDLPVYGLIGYFIAAVFGLWLVAAIFRSGRL
jgi:ubiquinone biosynthesis protein